PRHPVREIPRDHQPPRPGAHPGRSRATRATPKAILPPARDKRRRLAAAWFPRRVKGSRLAETTPENAPMRQVPLAGPLVHALLAAVVLAAPPATKKDPVADTYHGVRVSDDYRWLEDGKDKAVQQWSDDENAYARGILDKLPGVDKIRERVKEILTAKTVSHGGLVARGGQLFAIKRQPPREQRFLVVMPSAEHPDKARTLVDPAEIDKKGHVAIDWFVPSPDGKLVAVSLSKGGSEEGDVHVYDVATGK